MLAEIGQTGEKAFEQVKDAVEKAQSNLAVSSAVEGVEKQVGKAAAAGGSFVDAITDLEGATGRFGEALAITGTRLSGIQRVSQNSPGAAGIISNAAAPSSAQGHISSAAPPAVKSARQNEELLPLAELVSYPEENVHA